ncbi:MAG: LysR family transcriptional regulator [Jatrophihabitans sp.]|uniref:LysR family transcriptional regulator n=1 Tax=Jatrophihabitans sp. TaxID=1932789 RepID=UPI003F7D4159
MTLTQLRAFLEAARRGSFTAAAGVLDMSQASVSELIRRLEDEYDVQLFIRGRRRLVLTAAGQELLDHASATVSAADTASRALRSVQTLSGGVATLGVLRNADFYLLSGLVEQFCESHPAVRVRLIGQNSVDVAAAVAEGSLEAGVVVLPIDAEGLVVTPWARDEVVFVSADPSRAAEPPTITDLAGTRLVLYDAHAGWRDPTRRQLADRANLAGVKLDPWIEVEHVETAMNLVSRGLGDSIVSRAVLASLPNRADLHAVALDPPLYDTIAFIRRESVPLSSATREIARLAHTAVQQGSAQPVRRRRRSG